MRETFRKELAWSEVRDHAFEIWIGLQPIEVALLDAACHLCEPQKPVVGGRNLHEFNQALSALGHNPARSAPPGFTNPSNRATYNHEELFLWKDGKRQDGQEFPDTVIFVRSIDFLD